MLRLSRKTRFALEAVADIAYNARPEPMQSKEITERQGIPQRYLEQVMQHLVRAGILKGVRGPRGGYSLARERRRISIGDIARAIDAMDIDQEDRDETPTSALGREVLWPILSAAEEKMMQSLDQITLEDVCNEARTQQIEKAEPVRPDFAI